MKLDLDIKKIKLYLECVDKCQLVLEEVPTIFPELFLFVHYKLNFEQTYVTRIKITRNIF